jgi:hypothetical protein
MVMELVEHMIAVTVLKILMVNRLGQIMIALKGLAQGSRSSKYGFHA